MIDPELHIKLDKGSGYSILISGRDKYLKCYVTLEELNNAECALDPVIDILTYLRNKWVNGGTTIEYDKLLCHYEELIDERLPAAVLGDIEAIALVIEVLKNKMVLLGLKAEEE